MRYARNVCHHCHGTETDPRRLIRIAFPFSPLRRLAERGPHYTLTTHVTHVACFLEAGGSIADLSDSQLWHVPTRLWQRLGYLPGDSMAEYLLVQIEERDAARRAAGSAALRAAHAHAPGARHSVPHHRIVETTRMSAIGAARSQRMSGTECRAPGDERTTRPLRRAA